MSAEVVHRLGVAVGIVTVLGVPVWWLERVRRARRARGRAAGLLGRERARDVPRVGVRDAVATWLPVVAVAGAGWVLIGGVVGAVAGVAGAFGLWRWRGRQRAATAVGEADMRLAAGQLPLAADLLAACIAAGAAPVIAAQAVGEALGGPLGEALARGAAEVRLGGEPGTAWRGLAGAPGAEALARLLEHADVTGVPAADRKSVV